MASSIRVVSIANGGAGQGYDLTDRISGLRYSSVLPGGDESCSFTYKKPWRTFSPEIQRGCLLRVMDGVDVLWQGRIEESDHGGSDTEEIGVTAYGLGARLKDSTFSMVFVDKDLSAWRGPGTARKLILVPTYRTDGAPQVQPDSAGVTALALQTDGEWGAAPGRADCEGWYDAGQENLIGSIYFSWRDNGNGGSVDWRLFIGTANDDTALDTLTANQAPAAGGTASGTLTAGPGERFGGVEFFWGNTTANSQPGVTFGGWFTALHVFGTHGLATRGAAAAQGFTAEQVVGYIVGLVAGMSARRLDPQAFVIQQAAFKVPTVHEDAITEINKYQDAAWGTWGPDSPLDGSTGGYFDFTTKDRAAQHWFAFRGDCDGLDLHAETATLYDTVKITYTDEAGASQLVTRTAPNVALNAAGMAGRTLPLDAGRMGTTQANQLGDTVLAVLGGFAPARGSMTIKQPVRHYRRGYLPPWYMRADGSNVRIPDVLPTVTLFDLSSAPDRRTTFPIKRVEVDCSGSAPSVSVELDQTNDLLSVLQARLGLAAQLVGA